MLAEPESSWRHRQTQIDPHGPYLTVRHQWHEHFNRRIKSSMTDMVALAFPCAASSRAIFRTSFMVVNNQSTEAPRNTRWDFTNPLPCSLPLLFSPPLFSPSPFLPSLSSSPSSLLASPFLSCPSLPSSPAAKPVPYPKFHVLGWFAPALWIIGLNLQWWRWDCRWKEMRVAWNFRMSSTVPASDPSAYTCRLHKLTSLVTNQLRTRNIDIGLGHSNELTN